MYLWITAVIWVLDRLSKLYITTHFALYESKPLLGKLVSFTYVHNTGAAFSILQGKVIFLILSTIVLLAVILYIYNKMLPHNKIVIVATGLVIGGALGNFYDRILFGSVIDFIDFHFFPVFNIADSAIVVGAIFLSWQMLIHVDQGAD